MTENTSLSAASFDMSDEEIERRETEKKIQWDKLDVPIEYVGRAITLPAEPGRMPEEKAIEALQRRIKDLNQVFRVHETLDAYPHDGAVAFVKAMSRLYGWASPQTVMTFFGPKPPTMLSVKTGPGIEDVVQCPMGAFKLPGVDELVHTMFAHDSKGVPCFAVVSEVKKRDRHIVLELISEARRIVAAESIYKGRPIRLGVDGEGSLDLDNPPEFMDVSDTTEESILFDEHIKEQIDTNILVPIKHTAKVKRLKIPLKRGILLEGPFGTGKSLTARMVARVAEQHGWTFILLNNVTGLKSALEFGKRYAPAIVFAEDIDRIAADRDDEVNDLINIIDGVVSKGMQVMTVLTTNFVENISQVMLRPGRLDAVISIRAPGPETVSRLIHHYAEGLVHKDDPLTDAGRELQGQIPATIRECVERAKLGMIGRGDNKISDHDIQVAACTMKNHLDLLNREKSEPTAAERLAQGLVDVMSNGYSREDTAMGEVLVGAGKRIHQNLRVSNDTNERVRGIQEVVIEELNK